MVSGSSLRPENLRPTPKSRFHLEKSRWLLPTDSSFEKAKKTVWLFVNAPI